MADGVVAEVAPLVEGAESKPDEGRFLNKNIVLLWQGQLVSALGDVSYDIALGFWVMAVTGSTALMGTLMAASAIPRIVLSPFAGVWVDRGDRKAFIVLMDVIRGLLVLGVGIAALMGILKIWMVLVAGILLGASSAFFQPAAGSVLPDLVAKQHLMKANSAFAIIRTGSGLLGNGIGGFIYATIGAPLMFLFNGISYLFSAFTELFISVPKIEHVKKDARFWSDMNDGLRYVKDTPGMRQLFFSAAAVNFFASMSFVLILPFFQQTTGLGPERYGITMAALTGGMLLGMVLSSVLKISNKNRFPVFAVGVTLMTGFWMLFPLMNNFILMVAAIFAGGVFNAIINIIIETILQLTIPQHMRGKVGGLLSAISGGLTPLAMATGGFLGEFLPLNLTIAGGFAAILVLIIPLMFTRQFRSFFHGGGEEPQPAAGDAQTPSEPR
jgi:DHA3 family macrolide efflux protein-like MFS transporter